MCNGNGHRLQDRHNKFSRAPSQGPLWTKPSGMGDCFFFLGVLLRRCVCLSSRRGLGSLGSLSPVSPSVALSSVACPLVLSGCFFLHVGPVPKTGFIFPGVPLVVFYSWLAVSFDVLGLLDLSIRSIASAVHMVVCVVTDQMVGDRRSPGATIQGSEFVCFLRQPSLSSPADRSSTF